MLLIKQAGSNLPNRFSKSNNYQPLELVLQIISFWFSEIAKNRFSALLAT